MPFGILQHSYILKETRSGSKRDRQVIKLTFARALLATNVPSAGNSITILTFTSDSTSTAVIEVRHNVDTFDILGETGGSTSSQTLRAKLSGTRAVFTLLVSAVVSTIVSTIVSTVIASTVIASVSTAVIGGGRRQMCGGGGCVRTTRAARVSRIRPVPPVVALGGRKLAGRLVRGATAFLRLP